MKKRKEKKKTEEEERGGQTTTQARFNHHPVCFFFFSIIFNCLSLNFIFHNFKDILERNKQKGSRDLIFIYFDDKY